MCNLVNRSTLNVIHVDHLLSIFLQFVGIFDMVKKSAVVSSNSRQNESLSGKVLSEELSTDSRISFM